MKTAIYTISKNEARNVAAFMKSAEERLLYASGVILEPRAEMQYAWPNRP